MITMEIKIPVNFDSVDTYNNPIVIYKYDENQTVLSLTHGRVIRIDTNDLKMALEKLTQ